MRQAKLGKKHSKITLKKMSIAHMGNKSNTGRKLPAVQRANISKALKGKKNSLGYKHTREWKKQNSLRMKGEKHFAWKGDEVSYSGMHHWLKNNYGSPNKCENLDCTFTNPKRFEYANLSGEYKRDQEDYIQLCCSCHRKMDNGSIKIRICKINNY